MARISHFSNKPVIPELCLAVLSLAPAFLIFRNQVAGDASIYFTFIKNFGALPFQFQDQTVSFGATSPFHVLLHAPVCQVFGQHWILASKALNFLLIPLSVLVLNRAINGDRLTLFALTTITALAQPLLVATCQLYEASLAFFAVSLVYYLLKRRAELASALAVGSLYLVRPELLLVTVVVDVYLLWRSTDRIRCLGFIAVSIVPIAAYHGYMFYQTGELLPSSVLARTLRAVETPEPWTVRAIQTFSPFAGRSGLLYLVGSASLLVLGLSKGLRTRAEELLLLLPLPLAFLAVPPRGYLIRYLLPTLPICAVSLVSATMLLQPLTSRVTSACGFGRVNTSFWRKSVGWSLAAIVLFTYASYFRYSPPRYDYDGVLLRDLAGQMNGIADRQARVLIYEIQAQYYLSSFAISADATVGRQMLGVLRGKETFSSFVKRSKVTYVVTGNSFNYRRLFANTVLERLYGFDLSSKVGDSFVSDGVHFTKVLTNRIFNDPACYKLRPFSHLNRGGFLRVHGDSNPSLAGVGPMWNSVFRIQILGQEK